MKRHIATDNSSTDVEELVLARLPSVVAGACDDAVDPVPSVPPDTVTVDPVPSVTGVVTGAAVDASARKSLAIIAMTVKATKTSKIANLMVRYLLKC